MDTKQIRKQMKEEIGYNARQVTVKQSHSSIVFTVRDHSVNVETVKTFSKQFENVRYDEYTQCILRGGNTFVDVRLSSAVKDAFKAAWLPALEEAAAKVRARTLEEIPGTNFWLGHDDNRPNCYTLWNGHSHTITVYGLNEMAVELGKRVAALDTEAEEVEQPEEDAQEEDTAPASIESEEPEELNEYEERQQRRRERYEELADKADARSNAHYKEARRIGSHIPFGQPILVGHHSEGRARRDAANIHRNMGKSIEEDKKAEYYRRKAEGVGSGGVSSDDPAAIKKLKGQLTAREKKQNFMKTINKVWRSAGKPSADNTEAWAKMAEHPEIIAFDFTNMEGLRKVYAQDWRKNGAPFPAFELTNNNSSIKRIKDRIKKIERERAKPAAEDLTGEIDGTACTLHENIELNRVQILFDGKPKSEIRGRLKRTGFRWSPHQKAWQRHLNQGGINAARRLMRLD